MKLFKENITPRLSVLGDKIYPLVVDIKKGVKSGDAINFVTADNEVGILSIELVNGDEPYDISGCIVCGTIQRPDTSTLNVYCDIVGANKLEIPLGVSGTYQEGVHNFDLKIYRGNEKVIGVPTMSYTVTGSLSSDGVVEGDDRLPVLTTVLDNAQDKLTRLDKAIAGATNDLEVKEARDGEVTLNARLERDLVKGKVHFVDIEGSSISTESQEGYLENVEIHGNTWQDSENLEDIRSVGTKVEGQELYEIPVLSCGKNLFNPYRYVNPSFTFKNGMYSGNTSSYYVSLFQNGNGSTGDRDVSKLMKIKKGNYFITFKSNTSSVISVASYDKNGKCIAHLGEFSQIKSISLDKDCYLDIRIANKGAFEVFDIQLEEGTQATPYEPYQEHKLTILSPTPLEKVGDVVDRIICKDGVWGIEKNVKDFIVPTDLVWNSYNSGIGETLICANASVVPDDVSEIVRTNNGSALSDKYLVKRGNSVASLVEEGIYLRTDSKLLFVKDLKTNFTTHVDLGKSIEGSLIKYPTTQPQFIPLPHSQQVKLRTFADRTHIHFETEIEPTIKASVPKSLGATVNTHTTQIDNLNKELDRVKKLEESTVSTVTSDKGFTTVSETSNGYFEDVKIEGKTLVNKFISNTLTFNVYGVRKINIGETKGIWTVFPYEVPSNVEWGVYDNDTSIIRYSSNNNAIVLNRDFENMAICFRPHNGLNASGSITYPITYKPKFIVLEGDHTDKDLSYFEGLKSVGQDTDEISVSSVKGDGNLVEYIELNGVIVSNGGDYTDNTYVRTNYITVEPNQTYYIKHPTNVLYKTCVTYFYDSNKSYLGCKEGLTSEFTTVTNTKFIRFDMKKADDTSNTQEDINNCDFVVSKCKVSEYIPHQSNKKQILYYNPTTQTWEKPVLREWDSIAKHSDGKYYYHKRSGEVVLNGSEDWKLPVGERWNNKTLTCSFMLKIDGAKGCTWGKYIPRELSSKFSNYGDTELYNSDIEGFTTDNEQGNRVFRVLKTKLSTQDVAGFKQWLQANNVTVVYELKQEEIYECTNLDLITYNGETNLIVNSGAIQPKLNLKVLSNVSNVVKLLQEKVSVLENKFIKGLQQVLAGDMMSLAQLLYPEDFEDNHEIQTLEL